MTATSPDEIINQALLIAMSGDVFNALTALDKVILQHPQHRTAHIERGRLYFKLGRFEEGVNDYEYFYNHAMPSMRNLFNGKPYNKDCLKGKTVIITNDAGIGDLLQFVRYGILLKSYGATVVIESDPIFFELFRNLPWIDRCIAPGIIDFEFEFRIPLHYLFGAFGTSINNIPAFTKYLYATQNSVEKFRPIKSLEKITVGICWRSTNENTSLWTAGRAIALESLIKIFDLEKFQIISIQKEINENENEILNQYEIKNYSCNMESLNDTAGIIANCDLVVSTCTMLPHLSGAMGIPTFTLLSTNSCWRWLTHCTNTPWYPSMKLIRQEEFKNWNPVLNQLSFELNCFYYNFNR